MEETMWETEGMIKTELKATGCECVLDVPGVA
jgi:hypothetical protein